ncbi:hypothetical protein C8R43DRAFT_319075 [Mycena crocata]|nr:hypothetical protein C8R43DRAFT_319075 [Mycena crocata]
MSHPIALPVASQQQDYPMDGGSYTGDDGTFNPASYTRHFLGSPISWRAGSFGAQYVATSQSPTAMLMGSYDPKSPADSSLVNAWTVFDRQGELCRNYTCCGTHLPDLHALLEHFEEVHIVVKDRASGQPPAIQIPFNPQMHPPDSAPPTPHLTHQQPRQIVQQQQQQYSTPFDTDDMDLGLDDYDEEASPPPPSTAPTSTVTSRAPSPSPMSPSPLSHSLSADASSSNNTGRPSLNISLNVGFPGMHTHTPLSARATPAPFSAYARYSAASGDRFNINSAEGYGSGSGYSSPDVADYPSEAIAPALVFATGEELQGSASPPVSPGVHSPTSRNSPSAHASRSSSTGAHGHGHGHKKQRASPPARGGTPTSGLNSPALSVGPGMPAAATTSAVSAVAQRGSSSSSSKNSGNVGVGGGKINVGANGKSNANANGLGGAGESGGNGGGGGGSGGGERERDRDRESATILLPHKPFRCPKPNCSKSYKQANGLKYHMTHGSCNFGPAKDLEAVRALLERKRQAAAVSAAAAAANSSSSINANNSGNASPSASTANSNVTANGNANSASGSRQGCGRLRVGLGIVRGGTRT